MRLNMPFTGETYRPAVRDILMGRSADPLPRAKFHKADDIAVLFEGRAVPDALSKTAWWHFVDITMPGGEGELQRVHERLIELLRDLHFGDFPIVQANPEQVSEDMLDDIARLWPALVENA